MMDLSLTSHLVFLCHAIVFDSSFFGAYKTLKRHTHKKEKSKEIQIEILLNIYKMSWKRAFCFFSQALSTLLAILCYVREQQV